jgi:esterase/lipase superfamily enzyme
MRNRIFVLTIALAVVSVSGCTRPCHDLSVSLNLTTGDPEIDSSSLFFATDRTWDPPGSAVGDYGASLGAVTYGTCDVDVPVYAPPDAFSQNAEFEVFDDLDDYVSPGPVAQEQDAAFFQAVKDAVAASDTPELLLFVHGYNVSFKEAVQKTAFLAHRLGFDGPAMLFSWPSASGTEQYFEDQTSAEDALGDLQAFLVGLATNSNAARIHVVAHSLGARTLTDAFIDAVNDGQLPDPSPFGEIVLAAADIDAEAFRQEKGAVLKSGCDRVTLYVSGKDEVLDLSEEIHGGPRVGNCCDQIVTIAGIETIDASKLRACFLGHSYYSDSTVATEDLKKLILEGLSPDDRGLKKDNARGCWLLPKKL